MIEHSDRDLAYEELQDELRDLLSLAVVGDHVRWVVVGDEAEELAAWLADAVPQWRALADRVSWHLVTLGVAPDRRVRSLTKDIPLNWVPEGWLGPDEARHLVADRLGALAEWARYRQSQATDPDTVLLLDAVSSSLEALARADELTLVAEHNHTVVHADRPRARSSP
jgi:DNA-binding ferritin-like protein